MTFHRKFYLVTFAQSIIQCITSQYPHAMMKFICHSSTMHDPQQDIHKIMEAFRNVYWYFIIYYALPLAFCQCSSSGVIKQDIEKNLINLAKRYRKRVPIYIHHLLYDKCHPTSLKSSVVTSRNYSALNTWWLCGLDQKQLPVSCFHSYTHMWWIARDKERTMFKKSKWWREILSSYRADTNLIRMSLRWRQVKTTAQYS